MRSFRVVYDASNWDLGNAVWLGLFIVVIALAISFLMFRERGIATVGAYWYPRLVLGAVAVFSTAYALVTAQTYRQVARARAGACELYEGRITLLNAEPWGGHARPEKISIDGTVLEYSYFVAGSVAFRQTAARGGPLLDGVYARLCVAKGEILRVEVAEDQTR